MKFQNKMLNFISLRYIETIMRIIFAVIQIVIFSSAVLFSQESSSKGFTVQSFALGDSVGFTVYDLQTFQSMPERVSYNPQSKIAQLFWLADNGQGRGSYYSALNCSGAKPIVLPLTNGWQRIESFTSGGTSIASFSNGIVGTTGHSPVVFSPNTSEGLDGFTTYPTGTKYTSYARSSVGANDVLHLIYTFGIGANSGQIGYVYSMNKGETWSQEVLLSGANAVGGQSPKPYGADCYAIHARGNDVVLAYVDDHLNLWSRKSHNNGASWENAELIVGAKPTAQRKLYNIGNLGGNSVRFTTDTLATSGLQIDALLDLNGKAHYAFSLIYAYVTGVGTIDASQNITPIGNDTVRQSSFGKEIVGLGYYSDGLQTIDNFALPAGNQWNGKGVFLEGQNFGQNYSCYPQLGLDDKNTLYCVYTSVQNDDSAVVSLNGQHVGALFGHIFATHKIVNRLWSVPVNLTPAGVDCSFGSLANNVDGNMYIAYQSDRIPGVSVRDGTPKDTAAVRFLAFPVNKLNESPIGVLGEKRTETREIQFVDNFPNPFSELTTIRCILPQSGYISLELWNSLGMKEGVIAESYLEQGIYDFLLDAKSLKLSSGVLYCILRFNNQTITHKIALIR